MKPSRLGVILVLSLTGFSCATFGSLANVVRPPQFEQDSEQPAEIRLVGPGLGRPLGGAAVRVYMRVTNPNPFGFRLTRLTTDLELEGRQAATGDFPLGLPLGAREESTVPIDLSISFADIPSLANVIQRAATGDEVGYELSGTVGIDAGSLGTPVFGPMTLVEGELVVRR